MSTAATSKEIKGQVTREFDELFREYYSLIYRTAFSVTGSPEDAEDVSQTIFLRLFRKGLPEGFRDNPKPYLYRAAINASLNTLRSRKRHVLTADNRRLDSPANADSTNPEPPLQGALVDAIAELSPSAVEMLILRYEHDYSDAEIGRLLGKSRGVVAVTLHRARARLRRLLGPSLEKHDETK